MSEIKSLEDLFIHMLQDMYYAEKRIAETLPEMVKNASNTDLQDGFKQHLEETKDQISKLEEVFEMCGYEAEREECEAIEGLIEEGAGLMKEAKRGAVLDSALIAAAQKVEHYEIASYSSLCNIAQKLGHHDADTLLQEILEQEKATDEKLTKLRDDIEEEASSKKAA